VTSESLKRFRASHRFPCSTEDQERIITDMAHAVSLEAVQMEMHGHPSGALLRTVVIGLTAFLTVVDLFATQAILPTLTRAYGVTPAAMGFAVNSSTLGMAAAGLLVSLFSQRIDRRLGILISLAALSIPTALLSVAPDLTSFTILRVVQGLCMASAFTLTLAYLGEECSAADAGGAFAAYITGNVASNLVGRLVSAALADLSASPGTSPSLRRSISPAPCWSISLSHAWRRWKRSEQPRPPRWLRGSSTCAIRNCARHSGSDSASCSRSSARSLTSTSLWCARPCRLAQWSSALSIPFFCRRS
jgi:hypothetical protein